MSSNNNTLLLVSYDIIDNKRRAKVAKKLQDYGQRVQYSLFECYLNPEQYLQMREKISKCLDLEKDNLRIYKLCQLCAKRIESLGIGKGWQQEDEDRVIVI